MLGEPPAGRAAGEQPQRLGGVVDAERRAPRGGRRHARHERRQARLEYVEGDEKGEQQGDRHAEIRQAHGETEFGGEQQGDRAQEQEFHPAPALRLNERRDHQDERAENDRQVDLPVLVHRKPAVSDERGGDHDKNRHLDGVKREDAEVEPQLLGVAQHLPQGAGPGRARRIRHDGGLGRHDGERHPDGRERQDAGEIEDSVHPDAAIQGRRGDERHGEGQSDRAADHRHRLGAVLLAREVGGERRHRRGDRARSLDRTPENDRMDVRRPCGDKAPQCKKQQADDDHALPAVAVGGHPVGNLQDPLGQPVGSQRQAHERPTVAARELRGVHGEHRQDQKEPEHAQGEDRRERQARAHFKGGHPPWHGLGHHGSSGDAAKFCIVAGSTSPTGPMEQIRIRGARTHNLKNLNVDLPRNRLIVITGLSGSGKSSLAFDTLYAEGQRRYVESLSAYARQFLQLMEKPDVDLIEGLSPAISIEQKAASHNPRSTVGTITEIHDYLRLLYARVGTPYCPQHKLPLQAQSVSQMVDHALALPEDTKLMILAPIVASRKGEQHELVAELRAQGFARLRVDGKVHEIDSVPRLSKNIKHSVDVVVDRLKVRPDAKQRLAESFETALKHADGRAVLLELDSRLFSFNNPMGACPECDGLGTITFFDPKRVVAHAGLSLASGAIKGWDRRNQFYFQMLTSLAAHFRFDVEAPFEKLPEPVQTLVLHGTQERIPFAYLGERGRTVVKEHAFEGILPSLERRYKETDSLVVREELAKYLNTRPCPSCGGTRLRAEARHVRIDERAIFEVSAFPLKQALEFFRGLKLEGSKQAIAEKIVNEIAARLNFLNNVGLDYLSLDRAADTLSGGEAQRIRLASQIGSGLTGVMYVLDEPSIGLHQRDNARLLATLKHLRDIGNTVIVVEHDQEAINSAA